MKRFNNTFIFCSMLFLALCLASCESEEIVEGYSVGIAKWQSNSLTDLAMVESYFAEKGLKNGGIESFFQVSGKDQAACDKQARAKFEEMTSNLNRDELAAKLTGTTSFSYELTRASKTATGSFDIIAVWSFPAE